MTTTRPDPHASYREHVSSKAEAVEEDEREAQLLGWNVKSNARHDVKRRDYIDKLRFAIANEVAARVNAGRPGDDVYSVACDVINIPMVESLIECALAALNSGKQKQSEDWPYPEGNPTCAQDLK